MTSYWAEHAWLGGDSTTAGVVLEVVGGVFTEVRLGTAPEGAVVLSGVTLPGLANAHSHAFHRALRGRTQRGGGTFWTWREQMYSVAGILTPESYFELARAAYAEMALAGVTCVGEFHYLHHAVDGSSLGNAMSEAVVAAAAAAGVRITLLDACYLTGGIGQPLAGPQVRFNDGSAEAWAQRVSSFQPTGLARLGAAIHSVRAVPADELDPVVAWAREREAPLHVHVSEQRAENDACVAAYGMTPTELLDAHAALGRLTSVVHATHLTPIDIALLGGSRTTVCMCPTTERDLADGIGPARALASAGSALSVGSDSNAVIDLLEEARGIELDERLRSERRGHWRAADLIGAATGDGHASLGWPEVGRLARGAAADFVTMATDSVRLAGASPLLEATLFSATASDVREVVVAGRRVVSGGRHLLVDDVPGALASSIAAVT